MSGEHLMHDLLNLVRKDVFFCDSVNLSLAESAVILREACSPGMVAPSLSICPWKTDSENEEFGFRQDRH